MTGYVLAFLGAIIILFVVMSCVHRFFSDWSTLEQHYRAERPFTGRSHLYLGAGVGDAWVFKFPLRIGVDETGLHISPPLALFRYTHPALCIPLHDLEFRGKQLFGTRVELGIAKAPHTYLSFGAGVVSLLFEWEPDRMKTLLQR